MAKQTQGILRNPVRLLLPLIRVDVLAVFSLLVLLSFLPAHLAEAETLPLAPKMVQSVFLGPDGIGSAMPEATLQYPAGAYTRLPDWSLMAALSTTMTMTESLNVGQRCMVPATPYFTQFYGAVTVDGEDAPAGSLVEAFSPRGDRVGCFELTSAGLYGYMRVYGEDPTAIPPIPGMSAGETVVFQVSGVEAVATGNTVWQDDKAVRLVDLEVRTAPQERTYRVGWVSHSTPPSILRGQSITLSVTIRNDSN